jgi:G:T-mismatch repair DNA endonuclease (very short patch repair protein)
VQRDARAIVALEQMGWDVCVVWECETADGMHLARKLKNFLRVGRHKRSLTSKHVGPSG